MYVVISTQHPLISRSLLHRLLMRHHARLMMPPVMTAAHLCTAVFDGDMPLLRRLLHAGANANAGDYDKRVALHIAAADGNLPAVRERQNGFVVLGRV